MEETNKGLEVVTALRNLMDTVKHRIHHNFKEMPITAPQGMLVRALYRHGKMKVSDLSEKMGLSNSTVSGIIDRLENQGMVERIRSKEDRRIVYVDVTPEFKKNLEVHMREIDKMLENIVNSATAEELADVFKGLHTLQRIFDRNKE